MNPCLRALVFVGCINVFLSAHASIVDNTDMTDVWDQGGASEYGTNYYFIHSNWGAASDTVSLNDFVADGPNWASTRGSMVQTVTSDSPTLVAANGVMDAWASANCDSSNPGNESVFSTIADVSLFDFSLTSTGHLHFEMDPWSGNLGGVTFLYLDGAYVGGFATSPGDQIQFDTDLTTGHHNFEISGGASRGVSPGQTGSWESHTRYSMSLSSSPVPEPAALTCLVVGVVGIIRRRRLHLIQD